MEKITENEKINVLKKEWGTVLKTHDFKGYKIKKVYIFKDGVIKVIANYFMDNFNLPNNTFEFKGETKKKRKIDLTSDCNFIVKTNEPNSWSNEKEQDLYINGDINNYIFEGLSLTGERLDLTYNINGAKCSQCIGWNHKKSDAIKYGEFKEACKMLDTFRIDSSEYEQNIKNFQKVFKKYKKAKEEEKNYTPQDYKKMSLASGTSEEENKTMLQNNGLEV